MVNSRITRRRMMIDSARAAAGVSLAWLAGSCQSGSSVTKRSYEGFKIGACDWSLGKSSDPGSFAVARSLGLDGIQLNAGGVKNDMHMRKPEVRKQFLKEAKKNGMEISSLCLLDLNRVPYKNDPRAEEWVIDSIDVAEAMNVPIVMLPFFGKADLRDDAAGTDVVVRQLRQVVGKAEKAGVVIGIESLMSAAQHMAIIDRVGSPAVKVYYDVGNSHKAGYNIYEEIRWLGAKNLCEFHAKDYKYLFGQGNVDFPRVRQAMDDAGYRGWIQIEGAQPLGMEESYRLNAQYLQKVFPPKV